MRGVSTLKLTSRGMAAVFGQVSHDAGRKNIEPLKKRKILADSRYSFCTVIHYADFKCLKITYKWSYHLFVENL